MCAEARGRQEDAGKANLWNRPRVRHPTTGHPTPLLLQVIKPFKSKPKLPVDFEETNWAMLQDAVDAIAARRPTNCGFECLYQAVENLCLHKKGRRLYERLRLECDKHVAAEVAKVATPSSLVLGAEAFLSRVEAAWLSHVERTRTVRSVFLVLDRTVVVQTPGLRGVVALGLEQLRSHLEAPGGRPALAKVKVCYQRKL